MDALEKTVLPTYYDDPSKWFNMVQSGIKGVIPEFESARMAEAYYK